ncbi:uncharacterized protein LOC129960548 [Argiope bruennichi]|uniref:SOCS box domain-containing protein n=1 Tax=Argiope bruennichi TaxID=94029 RepID=A0A8T0FLE7_ARGBR|nr:uncharacterized protein LOC129960548 [Argiope bruennichi]KAF8791205.1 hypothetical protein HNY73_006115 [Argiope bruennichi]
MFHRHKIEYRNVILQMPDDIARYSSALSNSIAYLDLSTLEYSSKEKIPYTYNALYKRMEERATVLDLFHLDLPDALANYIKTDGNSHCTQNSGAFHIIYFIVSHEFIMKPFSEALGWAIRNSRDSLNNLARLLPLIQQLELCQFSYRNPEIYDDYIAVLTEHPEYPWIQILFLDSCCFHVKFRILQGSEEEVEHFLHAAQALKFNLFPGVALNTTLFSEYIHYYSMRMINTDFCPLNYCLYSGRIKNAIVLLKYGYSIEYEEALFDDAFIEVIKLLGLRPFEGLRATHLVNKRRMLLLFFMIINCYICANDPSKDPFSLLILPWRKIWRAISDPFLILEEIRTIFSMLTFEFELHPIYHKIVHIYTNGKICDPDSLNTYQPRSLKHLCRISIRKTMFAKSELPNGIEKLENIPIALKSYLRLYP